MHAERAGWFIVQRSRESGRWSWRRMSNGKVIAHSDGDYVDVRGALRGIEIVHGGAVRSNVRGKVRGHACTIEYVVARADGSDLLRVGVVG